MHSHQARLHSWGILGVFVQFCCLAAQVEPPIITAQPQSRTVNPGTPVSFHVEVEGAPPLNYQWRFNGVALTFQTNRSFYVFAYGPEQGGDYDVIVSNGFGAVTSAVAVLTLTWAPVINQQSDPAVVCSGDNAFFDVWAGGWPPLSYQWRFRGASVARGTNDNLNVWNVSADKAGDYDLVITNSYGAVTSAVAQLTVDPLWPIVYSQPRSQTVAAGDYTIRFEQEQGSGLNIDI